MAHKPAKKTVLFLCNSNKGKSQMAAGLAEKIMPEWEIHSAGVQVVAPGEQGSINQESAASLKEVGADMSQGTPKPVDPQILRSADAVIIVGGAHLDWPADAQGELIRWNTPEPSTQGIEGMERMRIIRDDIEARIRELADEQ